MRDYWDEMAYLRARVAALEQDVQKERTRADLEHRRADMAAESSRIAWQLAWKPRETRPLDR